MFSVVDAVLLKPLPVPATGPHRSRLGSTETGRCQCDQCADLPRLEAACDSLRCDVGGDAHLCGADRPWRANAVAGQACHGPVFSGIRQKCFIRPHFFSGRRSAGRRPRDCPESRRMAGIISAATPLSFAAARSWTANRIRSSAFWRPAPSIVTRQSSGRRSFSRPISCCETSTGSPCTGVFALVSA